MDEYTFPFSTCEVPYHTNDNIVQPYSFIINIISMTFLLYASLTTNNYYIVAFFTILFIFEGVHAYSHYKHLSGDIQIKIIHTIAYLANISYLLAFINITKIIPSIQIFILYTIIIILDTYFFIHKKFIGYFFTQLIFIIITNIYYYRFVYHKIPYQYIYTLIFLMLLLIILFFNEIYNCKKMLEYYQFPYHIIIESVGVMIFVLYIFILKKLDD